MTNLNFTPSTTPISTPTLDPLDPEDPPISPMIDENDNLPLMPTSSRPKIIDATFFDQDDPDQDDPEMLSTLSTEGKSFSPLWKPIDSSSIMQTSHKNVNFLGLPSHPDDEKYMESPSNMTPKLNLPSPSQSPLSPRLSKLRVGAAATVTLTSPRSNSLLTPRRASILSPRFGTSRNLTETNLGQKMLERSGVLREDQDSDSIILFVKLGRLSDFNKRIAAHRDVMTISLHPSDSIDAIIQNFKTEHPELTNETLTVYHNFRQIPNTATLLENTHFKSGDSVELISFNPNSTEWAGVQKALISSVVFGFGFALFFVGFTFYDTLTRGLIVITGFLAWFFSCVGFCIGTAESNVINPRYHPTQTQTWNVPSLN